MDLPNSHATRCGFESLQLQPRPSTCSLAFLNGSTYMLHACMYAPYSTSVVCICAWPLQVRSCVRSLLRSCLRLHGCRNCRAQHTRIGRPHRSAWQQRQAATGPRELLGQLALLVGLHPRPRTGACIECALLCNSRHVCDGSGAVPGGPLAGRQSSAAMAKQVLIRRPNMIWVVPNHISKYVMHGVVASHYCCI